MRAALVIILAVAAFALAGQASAASPAPGSLGASVSANVVMDERPYAVVQNMGAVATTFTAEAPDGWTVTPASLTLAPGEEGRFNLAGQGDGGNLVIRGAEATATPGDHAAIRFGSIALMQSRPFDIGRYVPTILLALVGALGLASVAYRFRHVRIHVTRAA